VGNVPVSVAPAAVDPNNPLAAFVAGRSAAPAAMAPPAPQRIEVDESAVAEARAAARKQGYVFAGFAALVFAGVGYVAGQASETKAGREKGLNDAKGLAQDAGKAKGELQKIAEILERGRDQIKQRKFPEGMAKELSSVNVDFDGSMLAGRRFSGFPSATTQQLVELITGVQGVNDRKLVIVNLLTKLQKPMMEQLSAPQGQMNINQVVVVSKDPAGNPVGLLSSLVAPIVTNASKLDLPADFTFMDPRGGGNATAPRYRGGDIAQKPAAIYVLPKTFESACPSETAGQFAQLGAQLANFSKDLKGEAAAAEGMDSKPGLIEKAEKLVSSLEKVGQ
jgi:hypothetical protein